MIVYWPLDEMKRKPDIKVKFQDELNNGLVILDTDRLQELLVLMKNRSQRV